MSKVPFGVSYFPIRGNLDGRVTPVSPANEDVARKRQQKVCQFRKHQIVIDDRGAGAAIRRIRRGISRRRVCQMAQRVRRADGLDAGPAAPIVLIPGIWTT